MKKDRFSLSLQGVTTPGSAVESFQLNLFTGQTFYFQKPAIIRELYFWSRVNSALGVVRVPTAWELNLFFNGGTLKERPVYTGTPALSVSNDNRFINAGFYSGLTSRNMKHSINFLQPLPISIFAVWHDTITATDTINYYIEINGYYPKN